MNIVYRSLIVFFALAAILSIFQPKPGIIVVLVSWLPAYYSHAITIRILRRRPWVRRALISEIVAGGSSIRNTARREGFCVHTVQRWYGQYAEEAFGGMPERDLDSLRIKPMLVLLCWNSCIFVLLIWAGTSVPHHPHGLGVLGSLIIFTPWFSANALIGPLLVGFPRSQIPAIIGIVIGTLAISYFILFSFR